MALESQGTNNPFDGLVDKLGEMNNDQNRMAHEAAVYSKELQDHLETDALNMSASQRDAMQQLIMQLKEGRLDDLENDKEQLLRARMEARRDDERNDTLFDVFKQLKLQFRLLQMQFKDEKGSRIFGFLVRTAIFSFLIGAFKGFMTPYARIGANIVKSAVGLGKTLGFPVLFENIRKVFSTFTGRIAKMFKFSSKSGSGGMFAKAAKGIINAGKDLGKLSLLSLKNVGNFVKGMAGFLTGKKSFLMGFTKIESGIKASGLVGSTVNKLVQMVLKPFKMLARLPVSIAKIFSLGIDKAANSVKGAGKGFANIGTKVFLFFKNAPIFKTIFKVLGKFKSTFQVFGKVFGNLLRPVLGLIGFVTGFIDGFKSQDDMLNKLIAGVFDGLKGAFRMLVGSVLDFFIITIPAAILGLFGMDGAAESLKSFSFSEFFDSIFDTVKNAVLGFMNRLRDSIADIGVGGIVKNIGLSLMGIFMKIAAFPTAVAAGAMSALANLLSKKGPMEAFSQKFNKVMSTGQATIDGMKSKNDGKTSDGQIIDALSKEGKVLQEQAGRERYPAGPPTVNHSYMNSQGGASTVIVNGDTDFMDSAKSMFTGNQAAD